VEIIFQKTMKTTIKESICDHKNINKLEDLKQSEIKIFAELVEFYTKLI